MVTERHDPQEILRSLREVLSVFSFPEPTAKIIIDALADLEAMAGECDEATLNNEVIIKLFGQIIADFSSTISLEIKLLEKTLGTISQQLAEAAETEQSTVEVEVESLNTIVAITEDLRQTAARAVFVTQGLREFRELLTTVFEFQLASVSYLLYDLLRGLGKAFAKKHLNCRYIINGRPVSLSKEDAGKNSVPQILANIYQIGFDEALRLLVQGAVRDARDGDEIRVELEQQAGEIVLSITNPKREINREQMEILTSRSAELSPLLLPVYIKLATIKNVIHRHGGTLIITGDPGQGATFEIRFPQTAI